jgi:hypothetical protein
VLKRAFEVIISMAELSNNETGPGDIEVVFAERQNTNRYELLVAADSLSGIG